MLMLLEVILALHHGILFQMKLIQIMPGKFGDKFFLNFLTTMLQLGKEALEISTLRGRSLY